MWWGSEDERGGSMCVCVRVCPASPGGMVRGVASGREGAGKMQRSRPAGAAQESEQGADSSTV